MLTGEPLEMTFPLRGADGRFRPFLTRIAPKFDENGVLYRWHGTNVDISGQVTAEEALRTSEMRFRTFAEAMPNHVWTALPDGSLNWFNSRVYDYTGLSEADLVESGWTRVVHEEDLPRASQNWQAAVSTGAQYESEFRLRRRDGIYRWFIARATPVRNPSGALVQFIGTNTDIEDQKRVSLELIDKERRLTLSQRAAGIASLEVDIETGQVIGSEGFWQLWGLGSRDSVHISVLEQLVIPDDGAVRSTDATRRAGTAEPVVEYRIRRADTGELRWLWRAADFQFDAHGKPIKMFGVMQDITERKAVELSLRESEARYKSAMSLGRMGSWETNFATGKRYWSPEAQTLFGFDLEGGIGQVGGENDEFAAVVHPDDRALVRKFHQLANTVDSFAADYRIQKSDGTILWLSGRGQVIERDREGKCIRLINVIADVTEQRKASDHVRFLMQEMSHRSKNLLAIIQSIARQMRRRSSSIDEFQERLSNRLQGLAASHDILVEQSWKSAELEVLVRRHLVPFVTAGNARVEVSGPDLRLSARAAQSIGLALHELATNAVKYGALSVPHGKVRVSWVVQEEPGAASSVRFVWEESGGPSAKPPQATGFGNEVLVRICPSSVGGSAKMEFEPSGLRYTLTMPLSALIAPSEDRIENEY